MSLAAYQAQQKAWAREPEWTVWSAVMPGGEPVNAPTQRDAALAYRSFALVEAARAPDEVEVSCGAACCGACRNRFRFVDVTRIDMQSRPDPFGLCYECRDGLCARCIGVPCDCPCEVRS